MTIKNIAPIKCKVHGYLHFAPLHRVIIDSPYFQRLHHILQNGAAFAAFPGNKNSRFAHSLGVGFLAGKMFLSGISKASQADMDDFLRGVALKICDLSREEFGAEMGRLNDFIGRNGMQLLRKYIDSPLYHHSPIIGDPISLYDTIDINYRNNTYNIPRRFIIDMAWASIVMYGLLHDIGHLPFSHTFENAIYRMDEGKIKSILLLLEDGHNCVNDREFIRSIYREFDGYRQNIIGRSAKPIHEIRGGNILNDMIKNYRDLAHIIAEEEEDLNHSRYLLYLSLGLVKSMKEYNNIDGDELKDVFRGLAHLVDGHIDADRLDYVLRDWKESGHEDGKFDISRIINNIVLAKIHNSTMEASTGITGEDSQTRFFFLPMYKALPAINSFFASRKALYETIVYHKCVIKSNALIEEIIQRIIVFICLCKIENALAKYPASHILKKLEEIGFIKTKKNIIPQDTESSKRIIVDVEEIIPKDEYYQKLFNDFSFLYILNYFSSHMESLLENVALPSLLIRQLEIIKKLSTMFIERRHQNIYVHGKNAISIKNIKDSSDMEGLCNPFSFTFDILEDDPKAKCIKTCIEKFRDNMARHNMIIYLPYAIKGKGASKEDLETPFMIGVGNNRIIIELYKNLTYTTNERQGGEIEICNNKSYTQERVDIFIKADLDSNINGINEDDFHDKYIKTLKRVCEKICSGKQEREGAGG